MESSQPNKNSEHGQEKSRFYFPVDSGILLYRRDGSIEYFPYGWAGTVTPKQESSKIRERKPKKNKPLPGTRRHKGNRHNQKKSQKSS